MEQSKRQRTIEPVPVGVPIAVSSGLTSDARVREPGVEADSFRLQHRGVMIPAE